VTVIDTTGVVDFLLDWRSAKTVEALLSDEQELRAPDVVIFEVLSALRRQVQRGVLPGERARAALFDLDDLPMRLHPSLPLRLRAWELRENLTAADALFVALAEGLDEPLATNDAALVRACSRTPTIEIRVIVLP
jgi:predicted nucleic acid-binding protein